jgi:glycosyltransferase involved in cell wall biosynthesis
MTVLYLSQNGITDHIGQSQVAPYVLGLAQRGYSIHLLTAEKPGREARAAEYQRRFDAAGVRWTTIGYHNRPPLLGQLFDIAAMTLAALRIARREKVQAVHCRSHPTIPIGLLVKRLTGARLLFDFRDFWVDSNLAHGRFVALFRWLKRRERGWVLGADRVVTLTAAAARHLAAEYPDPKVPPATKYTVIPCCADFDLFRPLDGAETRARLGIAPDATVLIYLGSIGAVYLVPEMMAVFAELSRLREGAVFLLVCNNGRDEVEAAADAAGVPRKSLRIVQAAREEIPGLIAAANLSVAFKRADLSNLGCSPTKLGETLACGVPVIANAGVGDLDEFLSPDVNGSVVLPEFTPATIRAGLEQVLNGPLTPAKIRASALALSLRSGVDAFASIYEVIGEAATMGRVDEGSVERRC